MSPSRSSSLAVVASWIIACASASARPPAQGLHPRSPVSAPSAGVPSLAPRSVTPAPGVESAPEVGTLPPLAAVWGTADPLTFVAAAPDRRWVAICQARRDSNGDGAVRVDVAADGQLSGDELAGYFVDAPGAGTPIDSFAGADPSGRFVVLVREGRVFLRDTTTRVDVELPADARDDLAPFVHPRVVSFDPTGRRLAYLQKLETGGKITVRELATGAEATVDPGAGVLFRADFDPSGESLVVRIVAVDTNGNGRLDWPVPESEKPWMRCEGPMPRFGMWERGGDDVALRVAKATGGIARDVPGLVVPMG
ncbi:MAG TPA: hypothetical protein VHU80_15240, partial [Polyangiaceae bacterium]|nr:hypothetical protein [Polyangiaceae bacterium]